MSIDTLIVLLQKAKEMGVHFVDVEIYPNDKTKPIVTADLKINRCYLSQEYSFSANGKEFYISNNKLRLGAEVYPTVKELVKKGIIKV